MAQSSKTEAVRRLLPPELATEYERCVSKDLRSATVLRMEVDEYVTELRDRRAQDAFLDLSTAERVAIGCHGLLARLGDVGSEAEHGAVQAAVAYFILEDDAEEDSSVIGFDDDLQVVDATFHALGWNNDGLPE